MSNKYSSHPSVDWLQTQIVKKLEIDFGSQTDNLIVIDWRELVKSQSAKVEQIYEYFVDDAIASKIESGELTPFGVLGLTHNPESFAEMSNGGLLVADQTGVVWHHHGKRFERIADSPDTLSIRAIRENEFDVQEEHLQPPFVDDWDTSLELKRQSDFDGAIACLLRIHQSISKNASVLRALVELHIAKKDFAGADRFADLSEDSEFEGVIPAVSKGQVALAVGDAEKAMEWANTACERCELVAVSAEEARAFAFRGVLRMRIGKTSEGLEDLVRGYKASRFISRTIDGFEDYINQVKALEKK